MEPETSIPVPKHELETPQYGPVVERAPETQATPETGIELGAERFETRAEPTPPSSPVATSPILPTPVAPIATVSDEPIVSDTPIVAADDDLIEKEWVDKAKKIIADTREDPYGREKAVGELHKDYIKKRYGKELGQV